MKFHKVIGDIDKNLVVAAERRMTELFTKLSLSYSNSNMEKNSIGGDPYIFSILYSTPHICTLEIPTAGTDGKYFYWNPQYIVKSTQMGLRIVSMHESLHLVWMHPSRIGARDQYIWNIAVDYRVHHDILKDFEARKLNGMDLISKNIGKPILLKDLIEQIKNPSKIPKGFQDIAKVSTAPLPNPSKGVKLTDAQKKDISVKSNTKFAIYVDNTLPADLVTPEKLYDYIASFMPKNFSKEDVSKHLGLGSTLDEHFVSEISKEETAKKVNDAINFAKKYAGNMPANIQEQLNELTAPQITWKDAIKSRMMKSKAGGVKNDWTRFRVRPMFFNMLVPKRKTYKINFGCLLDTSGSMSKDDISYGISQLQSLDKNSEGIIVPADAKIYWENATMLKSISKKDLENIKIVGRGGTKYAEFFSDYEKNIGKCNFIIVITDGYLDKADIAKMVKPKAEVFWIITSTCSFSAPFGKVYQLKPISN